MTGRHDATVAAHRAAAPVAGVRSRPVREMRWAPQRPGDPGSSQRNDRAGEAPPVVAHARRIDQPFAAHLGRLAIRALYREAVLHPKPGLVSAVDSGAHTDMNLATFHRSLFALRSYFPAIARLGAQRSPLPALQACGREAERAMLRATRGVNTHRGAIFNLGLLCAAAGALRPGARRPAAAQVCEHVQHAWGDALLADLRRQAPRSHGLEVARVYGAAGARGEAARGFATVRQHGLPAMRSALAATGDSGRASVHALFALIAALDDSNLLWRGGPAGLALAQRSARRFLAAGGALADDWHAHATAIHRTFVARHLSPGGSADLLAVTLFLHDLEAS
jgi:triphosphoribosyl-dephospho-CoA synthase